MKLTRYEMESIILYNAEEQTATLYTRDRAVSLEQREWERKMMVAKNEIRD